PVAPGPRQPAVACRPPECAAAAHPGGPARCGGHPRLVARAVARPRKKAVEEGRSVVWIEPSGCSLLPMAVRTWAPGGQTPRWRVPLTHDHLSAISAITADGRLFLQTPNRAYR